MAPKYQVVFFKDLNPEKADELLRAHASFEVVNVPAFLDNFSRKKLPLIWGSVFPEKEQRRILPH